MIFGIETSCDETAAALVTRDGEIAANVVASQAELHARYGGVVPEVASRRHLELVTPVIRAALADAGRTLDDVDTVAVTTRPGLIGALLVGLSSAKALAWSRRLPLVPVDHLHGHVASLYLRPLDAQELERRRADLAAGYQRAIVRALVERVRATNAERIAVVGGVAANSELRAALPDAALAPLALCTDNAAMIASAARYAEAVPYPEYLALDA